MLLVAWDCSEGCWQAFHGWRIAEQALTQQHSGGELLGEQTRGLDPDLLRMNLAWKQGVVTCTPLPPRIVLT